MKQAFRLSQAVLASTLFIVPSISCADIIINGGNSAANIVYTTGAPENNGNIQITNTGFVDTTLPGVNNGDGILVNSQNAVITLDPANINANAISAVNNGITITAGNNAAITVGSGTTKITATKSGIQVDSNTVNINNAGTINGAPGIEVTANGATFTLVNQATGSIGIVPNQAITLNGAGAKINNAGSIAGLGGINIGGQNATIVNQISTSAITGIISGTTLPAIAANATGLQLTNSGVIQGTAAGGDAIQLNQDFNGITNNTGGIISSNLNSGINITAGISGDIQNSGIIETSAVGGLTAGISIGGNYIGTINNNAGGIIQTLSGTGNADAIGVTGSFGVINNSGSILAVAGAGNDNAITIFPGSTTGIINNSGNILSQNNSTILLNGNITQINNNSGGTIAALGNASAIVADAAGVTLVNGINNSGTISSGGGQAIDLQSGGAAINIKLTQTAGTIDGDVLLASAGGNIFDMNGGTITGNVFTSPLANSTLNLNGGTIAGNLTLQSAAGNTVNIAGTALNTVTTSPGADIFNLTGGTFNTITGGVGDILNVKATYSTSGDIIDVPTVNVTAGTFSVNDKLTGFTNLNVGPNASMVVNSNTVTGVLANVIVNGNSSISVTSGNQLDTGGGDITLNNGGVLNLANSAVQTGALANTFTANAGGVYGVTIEGPGNFGKMALTGNADLKAGSYIATQLGTSGTFIPMGTQFDIITTAGMITDASTLNQPGSLTVSFVKSLEAGDTILRLTSQRSGYSPFANSDSSQGVAGALDVIAAQGTTNPQLLAVLGQLDLITNPSTLQTELESLAPPVNYSLIAATHVSMDQMFRSLRRRIEDMRYLKTLGAESYQIIGPDNMEDRNSGSGYSYGDSIHAPASQGAWVQGYGTVLDQRRRHQVDGYLGDATGFAIGMDWGQQGALVGGALNFTQAHMVGKTEDENVQNIQSVQGSVYSWIDLTDDIYVDTIAGFAMHHYKTRRNMGIGTFTTSAFGDFYGVHYGVQSEIGYAFLFDYLTVSPMTRLRYTRMSIDDYSESGAGGVSLTVQNTGLNEGVVGVGIRALGKIEYAQAIYAPELSFMLAYDFYGEGENTTSRFLGDGPMFQTIGIKPAQTMMLIDAGINVHTYDSYIFTVKGELDLRDHFYGYSGWVNLYRSW